MTHHCDAMCDDFTGIPVENVVFPQRIGIAVCF